MSESKSTTRRAPRKAAAKAAEPEVNEDTQPVDQVKAAVEDAPEPEVTGEDLGRWAGVAKAFKDHGIDPSDIPQNNAIYTDGYITVLRNGAAEQPRLNPWPSEKARADVFAAWWTAEGATL